MSIYISNIPSTTIKVILSITILFMLVSCETNEHSGSDKTTSAVKSNTQEIIADSAMNLLYVDWKWKEAEKMFEEALQLDSKNGSLISNYGWLQILKGNHEKALEQISLAQETEPNNPRWPAWHGWMLWNFRQHDRAILEAQKALDIDSTFAEGQFVLGSILADLDEFDQAYYYLEKANKNPRWAAGLGVLHAKMNNKKEALNVIDQMLIDNNSRKAWGIAAIYSNLGEPEKAMEWLDSSFYNKEPYMPWLGYANDFDKIKNEPRFIEILEELDCPKFKEN